MEPFSITCTTCQAKLKVRSAAAIGQILSCPKCESMVQVLAPAGWQADLAPTVDQSPTVLKTAAAPAINDCGVDLAAIVPTSSPTAPPVQPSVSATELPDSVADVAAAFENLQHLPVGSTVVTPPPVDLPPLSANWASPTETLWRKVALYAVVGGMALVVVGVAIATWLSGDNAPGAAEAVTVAEVKGDQNGVVPDPNPSITAAASNPKPDSSVAADTKPNEQAAGVVTESLLPTSDGVPASKVQGEVQSPAKESVKSPVEAGNPISSETTTVAGNTIPENATDSTPGSKTPLAENKTTPEAPLDPAKLLADGSFESLLPGEAPSPDAALTVPATEMTEAELAAAADAAVEPEPTDASGAQAGSSIDAAAPQGMVRRVAADSRLPQQPAEESLRLQLPQVTFNSIPLALLLGELSDLSTLPITFDLSSLSAAQISPDVLVSVAAVDKNLAEILTTTLASKKLTYTTDGRQVIVTTPAALAPHRAVKFSVEDLAKDEDQLRELAALLVKMVAPASWQFAAGPGKIQVEDNRLAIEQSAGVTYESVIFCERLRTARNLPTRSRMPADQLQPVPTRQQAQAILARNVACTFHAPTRLTEVLRYLEELSGAKIFVDWRSLAQAEFTPQDSITCALPEQPLSGALDMLLSPLGLSYRVLDKQTIEVFAQPDLSGKMTSEFYSLRSLLAEGVKIDVLLTGIRQLTGETAWTPETSGLLFYDAASEHLIVRHGNKVHGQVQHLLDELARRVANKKTPAGKG